MRWRLARRFWPCSAVVARSRARMQIAPTERRRGVLCSTSGVLAGVLLASSLLTGCGADSDPIRADDLAFRSAGPRPVVRTIDANLGAVGFVSADAGALVWSAPR